MPADRVDVTCQEVAELTDDTAPGGKSTGEFRVGVTKLGGGARGDRLTLLPPRVCLPLVSWARLLGSPPTL